MCFFKKTRDLYGNKRAMRLNCIIIIIESVAICSLILSVVVVVDRFIKLSALVVDMLCCSYPNTRTMIKINLINRTTVLVLVFGCRCYCVHQDVFFFAYIHFSMMSRSLCDGLIPAYDRSVLKSVFVFA